MESIFAFGVIAVVTILFYKFVDRRHKILAAKTVGVLLIIAAISLGSYFGYFRYRDISKKAWVTVQYSYMYSTDAKELQNQFAEKAYNKIKKTYSWFFTDTIPTDDKLIEVAILSQYLDDKKTGLKFADVFAPKDEKALHELSDRDWDLLSKHLDNKISKDSYDAQERRFQEQQLAEYKRIMKTWSASDRAKANAVHAFVWRNALPDDLKSSFDIMLFESIQKNIDQLKKMEEMGRQDVRDQMNEAEKHEAKLSFKVCNKRDVALRSVEFRIAGLAKGRSSENAVLKKMDQYTYSSSVNTEFKSDIIVPPNQCMDIEWTGGYLFFDTYKVKYVSGEWEDKESSHYDDPPEPTTPN